MVNNMVRVAINIKFGAFILSQIAIQKLIDMGWTTTTFNSEHMPVNKNADIIIKDGKFGYTSDKLNINWWKHNISEKEFRTNEDIVHVIEMLGERASASGSKIVIENVEQNDDSFWRIKSFDGNESIQYKR